MSKRSKEAKVKSYREALNYQDKNPGIAWKEIIKKFNISSYPYVKENESITENGLDHISAVDNLIRQNDNVAIAFRDLIIKKYDLTEQQQINHQTQLDFNICSLKDEELLRELKKRGYNGNLTREVKVISTKNLEVEW